jgi:hypothetical protein
MEVEHGKKLNELKESITKQAVISPELITDESTVV